MRVPVACSSLVVSSSAPLSDQYGFGDALVLLLVSGVTGFALVVILGVFQSIWLVLNLYLFSCWLSIDALLLRLCPFVAAVAPWEFQLEPGSFCRIITGFYVPMVPNGSIAETR